MPRRQEPRGQGGRPAAQRTRAALRPCGKARGVGLSCNGQGKVLLSALRSEGRRARARSNVTERLRTLACAANPTSQRMRVEDAFPAAQGRASSSSVANAPVSFATSKRFARGFLRSESRVLGSSPSSWATGDWGRRGAGGLELGSSRGRFVCPRAASKGWREVGPEGAPARRVQRQQRWRSDQATAP